MPQAIYLGYRLGGISCPVRYFPEVSSLNFSSSANYALQVLMVSLKFRLQKMGLGRFRMLNPQGRRLSEDYYTEITDTSPPENRS